MAKDDFKNVKKIMLRAPNWIGDAVMSVPAAMALKKFLPHAKVTVVAKPWVLPVFENNPDIADECVSFDAKGRHAGIGGFLTLARELRSKKFDMAVLFQNAFGAALLGFLARIPERAGYVIDARGLLLTRKVEVTKDILSRHQVTYYLNIVKSLGADVSLDKPHPVPDVRVGEAETAAAKAILEKNGVKPGEVLVGIAPGASFGPSKRWKIEGFKEVAERCAKEFGAVPVIFGGGEDAVVADKLSSILSVRHLNLAGKTKLKEFFSLAKMMDAFVTNDSGPMHVAAALGTPTVGMFGWTEPSLTGALGKRVKYISRDVDCKLCHKRECPYGHHKCMEDISADEVYSEVKAFLAGKEKRNG